MLGFRQFASAKCYDRGLLTPSPNTASWCSVFLCPDVFGMKTHQRKPPPVPLTHGAKVAFDSRTYTYGGGQVCCLSRVEVVLLVMHHLHCNAQQEPVAPHTV